MADSVRAAVLAAPGRYELQEFPYPRLEDGALLMQVEMVGICGTDKHTYAGETKQYAGTPAETDTPFPIIQGHENVGVVAEITPTAAERIEFYGRRLGGRRPDHDVPGRRLRAVLRVHPRHGLRVVRELGVLRQLVHERGARRTCSAGWAEYMYLRPDTFVYKVPDGLSPRVAVLAELMACTASLDKLKEFSSYAMEGFNSGDTVVVIGSGPLGLLHIAKADMMGAGQIIATDLSASTGWTGRVGAAPSTCSTRRRRRRRSGSSGSAS